MDIILISRICDRLSLRSITLFTPLTCTFYEVIAKYTNCSFTFFPLSLLFSLWYRMMSGTFLLKNAFVWLEKTGEGSNGFEKNIYGGYSYCRLNLLQQST